MVHLPSEGEAKNTNPAIISAEQLAIISPVQARSILANFTALIKDNTEHSNHYTATVASLKGAGINNNGLQAMEIASGLAQASDATATPEQTNALIRGVVGSDALSALTQIAGRTALQETITLRNEILKHAQKGEKAALDAIASLDGKAGFGVNDLHKLQTMGADKMQDLLTIASAMQKNGITLSEGTTQALATRAEGHGQDKGAAR